MWSHTMEEITRMDEDGEMILKALMMKTVPRIIYW